MIEELWMLIPNSKNTFVSSKGRCGVLKKERFSRKLKFKFLSLYNNNNKLTCVVNLNNKGFQSVAVARLVAMTYIENPNNFNSVGHKNGDYTNNEVNNLFWKKTNKEKYEPTRNVFTVS